MVDLITQYEKIKPEIDSSISEVLKTAVFIRGPEVKIFEENLSEYLKVNYVIGCANGTDALQIAMMALNLQPGDEVITACFTYVATAEAIALLKLKPVLVDVEPHTFNLDIDAVRKAIGPKTKAIVPVHLFGQCAEMEALIELAKANNLYIIEDVAQALGSEYNFSDGSSSKAGTMGIIGCTSFFPSKNLACFGDGGALFTNDEVLAARIKKIANHGQSKQYYHDEVGVNSRLDSLQAAVLNIKLKYLDDYHNARNMAAEYYDRAFANHKNIKIPARSLTSSHVFNQYTIQLVDSSRDALQAHLAFHNIPTMLYYPIPLNQQIAYQQEGHYPVTEALCTSVLSLPMHTELDNEQLNFIAKTILDFLK
jgi:dTDP-4-amino-4,6-dideoxygalactose transaminase